MNRVMKKSVSVLLSLLMVLSAVSAAWGVFPLIAEAQTPAAGETVTVVACSDYQNRTNDDVYHQGATGNAGGEVIVGDIVGEMQEDGIDDIDGFLCAGDYDYEISKSATEAHAGIESLKSAVAPITTSDTEYVLVQGNHDPQSTAGGTSPSGDNDPESGAYGVFVINERDYQWRSNGIHEEATLELAETMRRYFNHKIAVDYTAPIFVVSHLPLHFSMRSNEGTGENLYAKDLFDVLQDAGDQGLNIIYLFGHNHSNGWDDYLGGPKVFLTPGDSINIAELGSRTTYTSETLNFVYMNAGYTGYWERYNDENGATAMNFDIDDLSMTTFEISDTAVVINRYGTEGETNLKNAGIRNWHKNEQNFSPTYPVTNNSQSSPYTLSLTGAVDDTEYEIDPVVYAQTGSVSSERIYHRVTDVSKLVSGNRYVLVLTGLEDGNAAYTEWSTKYLLNHTLKTNGQTGFDHTLSPFSGVISSDSIQGDYEAYEFEFRASGDHWILGDATGQVTMTRHNSTSAFNVSYTSSGTPFSIISSSAAGQFMFTATVSDIEMILDHNSSLDLINGYRRTNSGRRAVFAIYSATQNKLVYPRVTDVSQFTDGGTYVMVATGTKNGQDADFMGIVAPETAAAAADKTGLKIANALPTGFSLGDSLSGSYSNYEWTFQKSGDNWIMESAVGSLTMTDQGNGSYNVIVSANGTPVAITESVNNRPDEFEVHGWTDIYLDRYGGTDNTVTAWAAAGNSITVAFYGTKTVNGVVTQPYKDHSSTPAIYPRITDPSQIINGEKYVMVVARTRDDANATALLSRDSINANDRTGFRLDAVPAGFSLGNTIEGTFGDYEWTFIQSGSGWKLGCDGGQFTLSQRPTNTNSYNGTLTDNGATFTLNSYGNGLWYFNTTVGNVNLVLDKNVGGNLVNSYNGGGPNRVVIALYGAKKLSDTTIQRYEKEIVNTTSDLDEGGSYVIVNGTNAINPANNMRAIPVSPAVDVNGTKYLDYEQNVSNAFTWKRPTNTSQKLNFFNSSNQNLLVGRSGEQYTYNQATSFEDNGVYIIVNGGYALTAESANTNNTRLKRTSVTVNGTNVTASSYTNLEWTYTDTKLRAGTGKYLSFSATSGISLQDSGTNITLTDSKIKQSDNSYYIRNNGSGYFDRTGRVANGSQFTLYKKTASQTSPGTYTIGMGTDTTQYITLTDINTTNHTAKILLHSNDLGNHTTYSRYIGAPVASASYNVFTESATGADFEFYKLTTVTVPGEITPVTEVDTEEEEEEGGNNSPIESVEISGKEARLYVGNISASTYTGLYFNVTYKSDAKAVTEEQIPIKVGDLIDYTGHQDVASYCGEPGDIRGLGAYYNAVDGAWFSQLILHLIQRPDYPEYPDEGSVRVGKTSGAPNFLTNGVTQVELTATGVPLNPGIDIVLMLDTSSSMTNTVGGITRINALRNSVGAMLDFLATPNATTGLVPDITMAIADFNGYWDTDALGGTTDTYISRSDTPTGTTPRTTTNSVQHCTILTGPNAGSEIYNNDAFISVAELADESHPNHFDSQGIQTKSGTNYDQALATVYKLFEARQAYNASRQWDRQTVVIFMSDGGPFQFNYFTSQSTTYRWNYWLMGTYDEDQDHVGETVADEPAATVEDSSDNDTIWETYLNNHNDMTELLNDFNGGGHWYFYNGKGNPNRFAEALKGDPDKMYTVPTKDATAFCNDRNSDGFCDLCGKCNGDCVDHDHDGFCDLCGHIDQCVHSDSDGNGYCDVCGGCMDGCQFYQYLTQVPGIGATIYSIMFCKVVDKQISTAAMDHIIKDIASDDSKAYPDAQSAEDLTQAFLDIASNFVQAGTNAYFTDTVGPAFDLQTATVYTKNSGEDALTFTLDPRPNIEVKKYTVYTEADYENGVISDRNQIGTRTGAVTTIETVSFSDDGTLGYSDRINSGQTNIYVNGVIDADTFVYNNTPSPVMIDTTGDGVNDYSLAPETFYWKIGIIEDTEFALSYWLYLTGSMEGTRDAGSFPTNTSAILWYDNYLGHECYKETISPVMAWKAATITYEFYLVNADGEPVNSAGTVVPFANRVLIGNRQTETFNLNSNDTQTAGGIFVDASAGLPDIYDLYSPDASFHVALYSGDDYSTSTATITDGNPKANDASRVTTYYYGSLGNYNAAGEVPHSVVDDYGNTHVAFAVLLKTTIVPDTVVIDYGLPVKVHVLMNDLSLPSGSKINAISATLDGDTNTGYTSSRFTESAKSLTLAHGTADVVNGDTVADVYVKYTPSDMQMDREETFYYEVRANGSYYYALVTVIPAANIYYEDSFLEFIDGSGADAGYDWQTAGEVYENVYQAEDRPGTFALSTYDANNVYGNDAAYDDSVATYSLGTAKYVTVDAGCKVAPESITPRATFTFCGTGFDVISVTSVGTGAVTVTTRDHSTGAVVNKQVVNTYYGYSYGRLYIDNILGAVTLQATDRNGNDNISLYYSPYTDSMYTPFGGSDEKLVRVNGRVFSTKNHSDETAEYNYAYGWLTESGAEGVLYQIPVIKTKGLDYGTYDVTIQPRYSASFDVQKHGYYEVYVDGIRIYDPAGTGDDLTAVVAEAYEKDNEINPVFASVRDTVIQDNEGFMRVTSGVGEETVGGTIMVDGMFVTAGSATALADLQQSGPNNEMYLAQYQAIAFRPAVRSSIAPSSFQLGMKVAITDSDPDTGKTIPSNASVRVIISDVKRQMIRQIYSLTVSGSAEQFYDLSPLLAWTLSEDGTTYVSDYDVVILNDSEVVLSLTAFKTTFSSRAKTEETEDELDAPEMMVVSTKRTLSFAKSAVQQVLTSADTSTLDIQWLTDDLTVGATAVLTVTTSSEITSVMIGNTEITEFVQNEDGTRTWSYEFTVVETGENAYDVILKDSFGRTSETFSTSVPLAPVETEPEVTEPTGNEDPQDPDVTEPTGNEDLQDPDVTEPTGNEDSQDPAETEPEDAGTSSTGGFFKKLLSLLAWLLMIIETILSFFG
ncbi:MAG: hypothetical protein IJK23_07045 [Clostridia bacterium]|nr:hypothetical protein [Clostridia bacterium]